MVVRITLTSHWSYRRPMDCRLYLASRPILFRQNLSITIFHLLSVYGNVDE